jgi:hypothetical protein
VEVADNGDVPSLSSTAAVTVNLIDDTTESPPAIPDPILVFDRAENIIDGLGNAGTRWHFNVTNFASYPAELFLATAEFGSCGGNSTPSRTWVSYYDAGTDALLNTFCGLSSPASTNGTWFFKLEGISPPAAGVYMKIRDRSTSPATEYQSNVVSGLLPAGLPLP